MVVQQEQPTSKKPKKPNQALAVIASVLLVLVTIVSAIYASLSSERYLSSGHSSQRRIDMQRLSIAVTEYKKNNSGKLPRDGAYLVEHYITKTSYDHYSSSYSFVDPDGVDYTVSIAGLSNGEEESLPNRSYTMYVLSNAVCDSNASKAKYSSNKNDLVVIYHPSGSYTMCLDIEE